MFVHSLGSYRSAAAALLLALTAQVALAQVPQTLEVAMNRMLAAAQSNTVQDFVAEGDPATKAELTRQMQDIVQEVGLRLKSGYSATFWGKLNQAGFEVYVWKIEFKDGKDDYLLTMATKERKIAGLWVH